MIESARPLAGAVTLVTGASRGIGRAAALAFALEGAHVIAVGRTQGALEELDDAARAAGSAPLTLVPMDLAAGDGVDQLGYEIHRRHGRLDVLVHAAAVLGGLRPVAHIPPKVWDEVVAVNLTAVFRLIRSLEALLRASDAGRAIFLSSGAAVRPRAYWGGYAATKAAIEALVRAWADEMESTSVRALIVDPGAVRTRMRAQAFPGEDPMTLPSPEELGPFLVDIARRGDPGLPSEAVRFRDWRAARAAAAPGTPLSDPAGPRRKDWPATSP